LPIGFAERAIDELGRARAVPQPLGLFGDLLRVAPGPELARFFTETAPRPPATGEEAPLRVRYFGHACVLAESKRCSVLFDPIIPYQHGHGPARFGFDDLPPFIDYAVITHNHQDHAVLETLLQLRHRLRTLVVPANVPGHVADPSLKLMFQKLGFRDVRSLTDFEVLELDGGSLTALPFLGEHGDLDVCSKASYLLHLEGRSILCAADSNNIEPRLYRSIAEQFGKLDALFVGMECQGAPMSWLYGPLLSKPLLRKHDQTRRLDGSNASKVLDIVEHLKPGRVYVYAMGAEPWLGFISSIHYDEQSLPIVESNRLVAECRARGIFAERLYGCQRIELA